MPSKARGKDQALASGEGCFQIQCKGKRSPSWTSGGRPRRKFCMSSAPVLAVVKMLTTSKHSGSQAIERCALGTSSAWSAGLGRSGCSVVGISTSAKGGLRIQQVKFLARLEANSLARSDGDFRTSPWVAADSRLARADIEDAKTPQLDPVARSERFL